ncbi:hypothetical protein R3O67_30990 [Bacillus cereus]|uniref:hypothetical protein n=1 Tax=Bacillus cereus TaxID=1396 RepID=UPI00307A5FCB
MVLQSIKNKELKTRKKSIPSEFLKKLKTIREKHTPLHVVEFEIGVTTFQEWKLLSIDEHLRVIRNTVVGELFKRYKQMIRTKEYKRTSKKYRILTGFINRTKDKKKLTKLEKEKKILQKKFEEFRNTYSVTFEFARKYGEMLRNTKYSFPDAVTVLSVCEMAWKSMERILFGDAEKPNYYKRGEFITIQGKQAERCIILKHNEKENTFHISHKGMSFPLLIKPHDLFQEETLSHIKYYMKNGESIDKENVERHEKGQSILSTYRIRNNRIVRKEIRGTYRYFVQITLEGLPAVKRKKDGSFRHTYGTGRIGGDIGTQSLAIASKETVELKNLAERSENTFAYERKIYLLQRYLDRSRRAMNPNNYNSDGTIKRGKKQWVYSKRYKKSQKQLRNLHRKASESRKYAHNEEVNYLRSIGDEFILEKITVKAWQKKAKEVKINEKTGKFQRRKRHGKSVLNRSPGYFIQQAKYRFSITGGTVKEVNTWTFKASQYDHVLDDTSEKSLSKRWHILPCGTKIQRDLYSAFLLFCSKVDLQKPNKEMCDSSFSEFLALHNLCIQDIQTNRKVVLNSGIRF